MSAIKSVLWVLAVIISGLLLIEAVRLLMLKHDITTYQQYWDKQNVQTASTNSTLYVALGDSTAQGIGASRPEKGYVGLLAARIANKSSYPVHIINLSSTGAKIQDVLKDQLPRLQQLQLPGGTIVTIEVGANDMGTFEPAKFSSQIEELFRQLPPQTVVADMPYLGGGRAKNLEDNAVKASAIIKTVASKYKLQIAPLHETTRNNDNLRVYGADFFHPSDRGYINWYKAFVVGLQL